MSCEKQVDRGSHTCLLSVSLGDWDYSTIVSWDFGFLGQNEYSVDIV